MRLRFTLSVLVLLAIPLVVSRVGTVKGAAAAGGQAGAAGVPDLSGDWTPDPRRGGFGQSFSLSDQGGRKRGQEDDIPYLPWAREKTLAEKPSTGPNPFFGETTDPQVLYAANAATGPDLEFAITASLKFVPACPRRRPRNKFH